MWLSRLEHCNQNVMSSVSGQGTNLGYGFNPRFAYNPRFRRIWVADNLCFSHQCFSFSLPLSFPIFLKAMKKCSQVRENFWKIKEEERSVNTKEEITWGTQWESSHLLPKKRALTRQQHCWHLPLGFLVSRIVRRVLCII